MIECLTIRGTDRKPIMMLSEFKSVIWQADYDSPGSFEIVCPYSADYMALIQPFNYVTRAERDELGIIENVGFSYDAKGGRTIRASGRFALSLLEKRLCGYPTGRRMRSISYASTNSVSTACRSIVNHTLISAAWTSRNIGFLSLGTSTGVSGNINETLCREQTVLEATQGFLRNNSAGKWYGQRMRFDDASLDLYYDVYSGRDLSSSLIFSAELENLLTFDYSKDTKLYKNRFAVAGDGEGKDQFVVNVNRTAGLTGVRLAEYWYKAGCSKSFQTSDGTEVTFTDAKYENALTSEVKSVFNEHSTAVNVSGTVDLSKLEYGTDFKEGDLVTIQDSGISAVVRIVSVIENQDAGGYSIKAEFGG